MNDSRDMDGEISRRRDISGGNTEAAMTAAEYVAAKGIDRINAIRARARHRRLKKRGAGWTKPRRKGRGR